jgi:tetratricopeptide (TPR) repeat protein
MEFSDQPHFSIAGVTDWTAVGGHGSDSILRTSESMASATAALQPNRPGTSSPLSTEDVSIEKTLRARIEKNSSDFAANHQLGTLYLRANHYAEAAPFLESAYHLDPSDESNQVDLVLAYSGEGSFDAARRLAHESLKRMQDPNMYRVAAEADEKEGNPLSAVREFERAARLEASEQNYFEWGSDLLRHRAIWQAEQVFQKGYELFPSSGRMLTGLGAALFAGARYEDAATHLCKASELNPADPNPYLFMGKVQLAAPNPLPCIEEKLANFARANPTNSEASYLYAMAILKSQAAPLNSESLNRVETLLTHAVNVNPKCADAFLQLGILKATQHDLPAAIEDYNKALAANPELSDAYYRLAVAYDRIGSRDKAIRAFAMHDKIVQQQTEAQEAERRSVKQFLFATTNGNTETKSQ